MYHLIIKDTFRQIIGRIISAIAGFCILFFITPYLGPLRYGDYGTILAYFGFWSALSDLGLYVLGLRQLGEKIHENNNNEQIKETEQTKKEKISFLYSQIVRSRRFLIAIVYTIALVVAYTIPSYTDNIYLIRGLPLGMIYSAGAMAAGIIQLPLQTHRKMEHVTISLVGARLVQILVLIVGIFFIYPHSSFSSPVTIPLGAFLFVIASVVISSITQFLYTYFQGKKYITLRVVPFLRFTWNTIKNNRQYGIGYFLGSAPMLVVILFLSWIYPTNKGFHYVGIWNLAIQIVVILLIIPPAIGNSLLHKITHFSSKIKKHIFGIFLMVMRRIGLLIIANTIFFSPQIIHFIGGDAYISGQEIRKNIIGRFTKDAQIGSDVLLIGLTVVLLLSFIKQVFTYSFLAHNHQNKLLRINGIGVCFGSFIGRKMIESWGLIGGLLTQLLFEIFFVCGSILVAKKTDTMPILYRKDLLGIFVFFLFIVIGGLYFFGIGDSTDMKYFLIGSILGNALIGGIWFKFLTKRIQELRKRKVSLL